jgi:integrase
MPRSRKNPNGAGSIYLRKDGRYHGRAYVLTTAGTYKRISVYGSTWEEANSALTRAQARSLQGVPVPAKSQRLADYLAYWLEHVVRVERRPKTYQGYELAARLHIVPMLGAKRLDKLQAKDVRVWLNGVRDACQCCKHGWDVDREKPQCCAAGECCRSVLSPRMVQFVHSVLRNALEHAVREELAFRNVAKLVKVPAPRYRVNRGLTTAQARDLLSAAHGDRLYALYALAVVLGLRRAELLGLRWDDVDLDGRRLVVTNTLQRVAGELRLMPTKTEGSVRTIPLPSLAVEALTEHRDRQRAERMAAGARWRESGHVFTSTVGTPLEPDNLRRSWDPIRRGLGLSIRFHDLRHTCVSLLLDLGAPPHVVREIAGHADIGVTMTIYAHASLAERVSALDQLSDRLS